MNSRTRQAINADIRALLDRCDRERRAQTSTEQGRLDQLKAELDDVPYGDCKSLREQREAELREPLSHAERAAIIGEARPAPRSAALVAVVSLADHRRAVQQDQLRARALAFHEAGHAVVAAAQGHDVQVVAFTYSNGERPYVESGYCRSWDLSAVGTVAGAEAARVAGCDHPAGALSEGDQELLRVSLGASYSFETVRAAEKMARAIVQRHTGSLAAVSSALLDHGTVEGAELERLLAPVRKQAA